MTENLAHPQFSKGLSGYKVEEVDSYIDKVLDTIKDLKDQNEVLEEKIGVLAESLQKYREDEDSLREALLGAQKMGDSIVKNANNKAEITMREASVKAAHIVEEARKKVEDEKDELIRVQTAAADFKAKLIELYREHIELVTRIPVSDSGPRRGSSCRGRAHCRGSGRDGGGSWTGCGTYPCGSGRRSGSRA